MLRYKLHIFDFYDTLVYCKNGEAALREGTVDLFQAIKGEGGVIVISSDGYVEYMRRRREDSVVDGIRPISKRLGIDNYITNYYGAEHIFRRGADIVKDIGRIMENQKCSREETVFWGDNGGNFEGCIDSDEVSTRLFEVRFILVPDGKTFPSYNMMDLWPKLQE
jgi:phosphoserine phosphatase